MVGHYDERRFARLIAAENGFPLVEVERDVANVDLTRMSTFPPTCRPSRYPFVMDTDDAEITLAKKTGAEAFFSGLAGDTVFYNTQRPIGAIDYAYMHPLRSRLLVEVGSSAMLSGESFFEILQKAVRHGLLRQNMPDWYHFKSAPHLLTHDAVQLVTKGELQHPWMEHVSRIPHGKRSHTSGIAQASLYYTATFFRESLTESINPLASQPLVELSLNIPSFVHLVGGVSRGLARMAFSDYLPKEIAKRTVKGVAVRFWHDLLVSNIDLVRDALVNGELIKNNLLDHRKVAKYLVRDQPFLEVSPVVILSYFAAEAWLSQWVQSRSQHRDALRSNA